MRPGWTWVRSQYMSASRAHKENQVARPGLRMFAKPPVRGAIVYGDWYVMARLRLRDNSSEPVTVR
jgi:hypothetical protein